MKMKKILKAEIIKFPYWYKRICAKMIILKNIKNSSLVKVFFVLREVIPVIKKSNIITKFLVTLESLINIIWYYFLSKLKSKKLN